MKLYYFPGSCALAPHIVLEWLKTDYNGINIEYECIEIEKNDPELDQINPLGSVPVLEIFGQYLTQAEAILHFLAESCPHANLSVKGELLDVYKQNQWLSFLTGDLHPAFYPFFNPYRYTTLGTEVATDIKQMTHSQLERYLAYMDDKVPDSGFLLGEEKSIVDAYALPMLRWAKLLPVPLPTYKRLFSYYQRLISDAGVQRALHMQGISA